MTWNEPIFTDNIEIVQLNKSRVSRNIHVFWLSNFLILFNVCSIDDQIKITTNKTGTGRAVPVWLSRNHVRSTRRSGQSSQVPVYYPRHESHRPQGYKFAHHQGTMNELRILNEPDASSFLVFLSLNLRIWSPLVARSYPEVECWSVALASSRASTSKCTR